MMKMTRLKQKVQTPFQKIQIIKCLIKKINLKSLIKKNRNLTRKFKSYSHNLLPKRLYMNWIKDNASNKNKNSIV